MKPPSGSCCRGWSIASIALSITGMSTRIGRLVRANDAYSGSSHLVRPNDCCLRMDSSPNMSAHDGIYCQRPRTVKR
jgi:hypothetical protein